MRSVVESRGADDAVGAVERVDAAVGEEEVSRPSTSGGREAGSGGLRLERRVTASSGDCRTGRGGRGEELAARGLPFVCGVRHAHLRG